MDITLETAIEAMRVVWPQTADPWGAHDQCLHVSAFFLGLLEAADVACELVGGTHQDPDGVIVWGHYAVRVGDVVYDWTARQFYPPADWPAVVSWEQWSAHLRIENRGEYLKA